MIMRELVEDFLEAEGVLHHTETYREAWGDDVTVFTITTAAASTVRIHTFTAPPLLRIRAAGRRNLAESFVSVTADNPDLVRAIVRAALRY